MSPQQVDVQHAFFRGERGGLVAAWPTAGLSIETGMVTGLMLPPGHSNRLPDKRSFLPRHTLVLTRS